MSEDQNRGEEAAAWHGLATNLTLPVAERLKYALKALDSYEQLIEAAADPLQWMRHLDADLAAAEKRGFRRAIEALRTEAADFATKERRNHPFHFAADFLEHRAAARHLEAITKDGAE